MQFRRSAEIVRVATCHDACPAWTATACCQKSVCEPEPCSCDRIDPRCTRTTTPRAPEIIPAHIVSDEQDDVGSIENDRIGSPQMNCSKQCHESDAYSEKTRHMCAATQKLFRGTRKSHGIGSVRRMVMRSSQMASSRTRSYTRIRCSLPVAGGRSICGSHR